MKYRLAFQFFVPSFTSTLVLVLLTAFFGRVMADDRPGGVPGIGQIEKYQSNASEAHVTMKIRVRANGNTTLFELNNSQAAKDLYAQLPLSIEVKNYSDNEKIFYPPKKLNTSDAPQADAKTGSLAYYAPWGDVVMFYDNFGSATGLYSLGNALSGSEYINEMTGNIQIEEVKNE